MKILETLESIRICDDEKARRVLNVSTETASISADEIERGVTIERLAEIGVPVFRYSTQVTIHGVIPDFNPEARPLGYKSIFRNQNGSLGVKYVAIDGAKKKLIVQAANLSKLESKFSAHLNSSGLELAFCTTDKDKAISAFKAFPKDLIIGGLYAARGLYGEYFVVADIGAIEASKLWPLINALYGFADQTALDSAQSTLDAEYAAKRAQWDKESAERQAQREIVTAQNKAKAFEALQGFQPIKALPQGECQFITVNESGEIWLYSIIKRAFGQLCYASHRWQPGNPYPTVDTSKKMKRWKHKLPIMAKRAQAGQVFKA